MTKQEKQRFYGRKVWQDKRIQILRRDHYQCQDCVARIAKANKEGRMLEGWQRYINRATCVHHIKELEDHPELALDDSNLVALCDRCHNERHERTVEKFFTRYQFKKKKKYATEEKW